jgi:hypothetical protein
MAGEIERQVILERWNNERQVRGEKCSSENIFGWPKCQIGTRVSVTLWLCDVMNSWFGDTIQKPL